MFFSDIRRVVCEKTILNANMSPASAGFAPCAPYNGSALDPLETSAVPRPLAYISSSA